MGQEGKRDLTSLTFDSFFLSYPLSTLLFFAYLISSEALRQDPVVDVVGDTGKGAVDNFRGAPLGDAFRDSFSVGTIGEGEELPVHPSSHLRDTNSLSE